MKFHIKRLNVKYFSSVFNPHEIIQTRNYVMFNNTVLFRIPFTTKFEQMDII